MTEQSNEYFVKGVESEFGVNGSPFMQLNFPYFQIRVYLEKGKCGWRTRNIGVYRSGRRIRGLGEYFPFARGKRIHDKDGTVNKVLDKKFGYEKNRADAA